jgi:[NiFe] hydrogenase diaphorase moiety small subunit
VNVPTQAITLIIDGREIHATAGATVLEAAETNGIYIPRLCWMKELTPFGACRVCLVRVNGRPQTACTQQITEGMVIDNDTEELRGLRKNILDMLFVEGNHFCMFCEKSGNCELQAMAYRHGIAAPKYPDLFPKKELDASHPDVMIDRNRCMLCSRCVRASKELDGKGVFGFEGRSLDKRLAVSSAEGLGGTTLTVDDHAVRACPTGCLLEKRVGYAVPVGQRRYDDEPIGSEIENGSNERGSRWPR